MQTRAAKGVANSSCKMELQTRAAKRSYEKESRKGTADRSCKFRLQKGVGNRNCRKELPNSLAKGRRKDLRRRRSRKYRKELILRLLRWTVFGHRVMGICIFRRFSWRRVFKSPTEPKCCKYQSNLAVYPSKLGKVEHPKSSDSSWDWLLKKRTARTAQINFYGVFGTSDINLDWYLQYLDPPEANFRRYLQHLSSKMELSSTF